MAPAGRLARQRWGKGGHVGRWCAGFVRRLVESFQNADLIGEFAAGVEHSLAERDGFPPSWSRGGTLRVGLSGNVIERGLGSVEITSCGFDARQLLIDNRGISPDDRSL